MIYYTVDDAALYRYFNYIYYAIGMKVEENPQNYCEKSSKVRYLDNEYTVRSVTPTNGTRFTYSARSSQVVTHPSTNRGRYAFTYVSEPAPELASVATVEFTDESNWDITMQRKLTTAYGK